MSRGDGPTRDPAVPNGMITITCSRTNGNFVKKWSIQPHGKRRMFRLARELGARPTEHVPNVCETWKLE